MAKKCTCHDSHAFEHTEDNVGCVNLRGYVNVGIFSVKPRGVNPFIMGFVYLLPKNPHLYNVESNGIDVLDQYISTLKHEYGYNTELMLFGDYNARAGRNDDFVIDNESDVDILQLGGMFEIDTFRAPRATQDTVTNRFDRNC